MAAGLLLGRLVPRLGSALSAVEVEGISLPIAVGLLVMMYPVLAKVRYDRLDEVTTDRKLVVSSLMLNWLIGPAVMFTLAWLLAGRSARVPHGADHRGVGPLYRHGHHLERPGPRGPRSRSRSGRLELVVSGCHVRRDGLVLLVGVARLAGLASDRHRRLPLADRQIGSDLPGHPAAGRIPVAPTG